MNQNFEDLKDKYYSTLLSADSKIKENEIKDEELKSEQAKINYTLNILNEYEKLIAESKKKNIVITIKELVKFASFSLLIYAIASFVYNVNTLNILAIMFGISFPISSIFIVRECINDYQKEVSFYKDFYAENIDKKDELQKDYNLLERKILMNRLSTLCIIKIKKEVQELLNNVNVSKKEISLDQNFERKEESSRKLIK